jgi:D-glycero-D-manno-heptose 1,7-bisphosphate phosphatase
MKRPAVFFDRDNTLIVSDGYLGDPSKVTLVDGAADSVARVRSLGFATVVFSNQSGVARGMFGEDAVHAVNGRMDELLLDNNPGAVVDRHEFCPFHPEATVEAYRQDSPLRKPRPGMITQAGEKLALDLSRSWAIGDAPRDVEAGHAAGCRTILVKDARLPPSPAANSASDVEPDFVVSSLAEAVDVIARETLGPGADEGEPAVAEVTEPANPPEPPETIKLPSTPAPATPTPAPTPAPRLVPPAPVEPEAPSRPPPREPAAAARPSNPAPPQPAHAPPPAASADSIDRLEDVLQQILLELRRENEQPHADFSVSKLMAGIVQVIALAALFMAYFRGSESQVVTLLTALTLQCFTIALLIMGRQR